MILCLSSQAQDRKGWFSPEQFNAKQQAYMTDYANLTPEESSKFFPLYYELQEKKRDLHKQNRDLFRQGRDPLTTDKQYKIIVETSINNSIKAENLDKIYLRKFESILSAKKMYAIKCAEFSFNREVLKKITHNKEKSGR